MIAPWVERSETFRFRTTAGIYSHARLFNNPCKSPLLDTEYRSATFAASDIPTQYEVRAMTTGLLIRKRGL
jgi:hypothetical protein